MRGKIDWHGQTDVGKVRETNEDQFLIADLNKSMLIHQTSLNLDDHTRLFGSSQSNLLAVADGMGGHAGGRRASSLAMDTLAHYVLNTMSWLLRLQDCHEDDLHGELEEALRRCQQRIEAEDQATGQNARMGTTLTMAYITWPRLYVVHAGDSRCYLARGGRLEQITRDHTVAQRFVEAGALTPEDAAESRWSHVLWNCIGGGTSKLDPEVYKSNLHSGDTLLLCTDGLSGKVSDADILKVLKQDLPAQQTCQQLVQAANEAGGGDNITVVVAHFRDADHQQRVQHHAAHAVKEENGSKARTATVTAT